ncbi:DNA cytosine methyltransferase [Campylobacter lari]|uniref:Cytosine-specific methyltransferase n=1 Tax=Campylobacter lari TaxID=201 RepID=A0A6L1L1L4_CAMLA|nr:DNA cytosine methyltransferase [Campylobacter lari]
MFFSSLELFAGAGGLAIGLEMAGFNNIGLVEIDKDACHTLKNNRPEWNVVNCDILELVNYDLCEYFKIQKGELDLISGGSPCQSFSYAGKKLGLKDSRGNLFYSYVEFLKQLQPKSFLFENVKGLLTHDKGKTFNIILDYFEKCGYMVQYKVLNANSYGVAQKRERLIVVGIREDLKENLKFNFPKEHNYKPVLKDVLLDVPDSYGVKYSKEKESIFKLVPPGGYWKHIDENIAKKYMKSCWNMAGGKTGILRRLSMDEPCLTILTSPQMKQTDRCHPLYERPFNIRESARIQSFPDNWEFFGSINSQYKQIGNAVPCLLAYAVGKQLYDLFISRKINGKS